MIERGAKGGDLVGPALRKPQQSKARLGTGYRLASMKECFPLNPRGLGAAAGAARSGARTRAGWRGGARPLM
jgi:hypothetical protein